MTQKRLRCGKILSIAMVLACRVFHPLLSAALVTLLFIPLPAQVAPTPSPEASPEIKIDGQTGDWPAPKIVRDAKTGVEVAFQNDGRNLFVLFIARKPEARESLASTGLTVLARDRGTKTSQGVLLLTRTVPAEAYIGWHESQGAFMTEAEKTSIREVGRHDLCLTYAVGASGSIHGPLRRLDNAGAPPECAVSEEVSGTTYEIRIPLSPPGIVPGGLSIAPGETVKISFDWGGASRRSQGTKATRETPPSERGGLEGVASPAQEFLNMFDPLSRPTRGAKKFSFAVDVKLADAK